MAVLLRRPADDDRLEDRAFPHGHRLDPQVRERLDRRVEAGVVAERTLRQPLAGLHPALQHHLGVGRHLQRHAEAVHHLHSFALQEAGEQVLVDVGRQRRAGGVGHRRRAAERDRHRQPLTPPLRDGRVRGGVLVDLPVQADGAFVLLLQPIHAEVASAGLRVLGVGQAEVEEHPAVVRPRLHARQQLQIHLLAGEHHLLAGCLFHVLGRQAAQLGGLAECLPETTDTLRQLRLEQLGDPAADLVQAGHAKRPAHPGLGAEQVHQQRHPAPAGVLEQQCRAVGFENLLNDPGDLQARIDRHGHALQLAGLLQRPDEFGEVGVGHRASMSTAPAGTAARSPRRHRSS